VLILFGGKEYAVGLSWFSISSPDEIDQFKREMDLTHGVVKLSKEEGLPSTVALAPTEYTDQVSLAAALSYAHENLLYVCKTDYKDEAGRQLYYLCCVKRGAVTVDGDTMGDMDTIQSLYGQSLIELRNDLPEESIECFGTDVDDNRFEGAQPIDAAHLVTSIQRFESQCVIKELRKAGLSKTTVLLVAMIFLVVSYGGYRLFLAEKPAPPPPPVAVAPKGPPPPPPDPFLQFLHSVQFDNTITPAGLPFIVKVIETIPMQIKGWEVTGIDISLGETTTFSISFTRDSYATVLGLQAAEKTGLIKDLNIDPSGESASATWPMEIDNMPMLTQAMLMPIKAGVKPTYRDQFVTIVQTRAMDLKFEAPDPVGGFSVQTFSDEGAGLWSLRGIYNVFQQLPTMGITSVSVTPTKGEFQWSIQGVVYG
jgi:hypothetical protein